MPPPGQPEFGPPPYGAAPGGPPGYDQPGYGPPDAGQSYGQPQYGQSQYGQPQYGQPSPPGGYQPGYPPGYSAQPRARNTMAIASLVLSLLGFLTAISAPVGAILGHIARRQIRQTGEEGGGLALAGIIIGWAITGLVLIGCCIAGIVLITAGNSTNY